MHKLALLAIDSLFGLTPPSDFFLDQGVSFLTEARYLFHIIFCRKETHLPN